MVLVKMLMEIDPLPMRGSLVMAIVGVKTGRSRVGGPELCVRMVTGGRGHGVLLRFGPS